MWLPLRSPYTASSPSTYRFRTHAAETEYRSSLTDGFSENYLVMDSAGKDAPVKDQLFALQVLAGRWNDYEGGFPVR